MTATSHCKLKPALDSRNDSYTPAQNYERRFQSKRNEGEIALSILLLPFPVRLKQSVFFNLGLSVMGDTLTQLLSTLERTTEAEKHTTYVELRANLLQVLQQCLDILRYAVSANPRHQVRR